MAYRWPRFHSITRRGLLRATAAGAGGALAATVFTSTAAHAGKPVPVPESEGKAQRRPVTLRWLGNSAWEIRIGDTIVLMDPWLTRFPTGAYSAAGANPETPLTIDPAILDANIARADLILLSHAHFDHMADVPYLAARHRCTVLGTASHLNMLRAFDVPECHLREVSGGARVGHGGITIDVLPSLHSISGVTGQVPFPGTRTTVPPRPTTVADLVEGGTLAYLITIHDGPQILALGSGNYIEDAVTGLRPDLAIVPTGRATYATGLMGLIGSPRWVLPSHWDDIDYPLAEPARDWGGLTPLCTAITAASPSSTIVTLEHLESFTPDL